MTETAVPNDDNETGAAPVAPEVPQPGAPTEEELAADPNLWGGQPASDADLPDEEGDAGVGDVALDES